MPDEAPDEEFEQSEVIVVDPGDTVLVADPEPDESPDEDTEPVVVNVDVETPDESSDALDAVVVATEMTLIERVTRLEEQLAQVDLTAWRASMDAEDALAQVEQAEEVIEDVAEVADENFEEIADAEVSDEDEDGDLDIVADVEPVSNKVHPFFRSAADWRNR